MHHLPVGFPQISWGKDLYDKLQDIQSTTWLNYTLFATHPTCLLSFVMLPWRMGPHFLELDQRTHAYIFLVHEDKVKATTHVGGYCERSKLGIEWCNTYVFHVKPKLKKSILQIIATSVSVTTHWAINRSPWQQNELIFLFGAIRIKCMSYLKAFPAFSMISSVVLRALLSITFGILSQLG